MEGDFLVSVGLELQPASSDQLINELGMVNDLVISAKCRLFLANRVQTVGAGSDDTLRGDFVKHLDIGRRHLIK